MSLTQYNPTFDSSKITVTGLWDRGAFHRAVDIARELWQAGQWNGTTPITINEAYTVHNKLFGVQHMTANDLTPDDYTIEGRALVSASDQLIAAAGQAANRQAEKNAFADYLSRLATNTAIRHRGDLARFAVFLDAVYPDMGAPMHGFSQAVGTYGKTDQEQTALDPAVWQHITWGMVEAFRNWMISQGDAMGSVNVRLSTIKSYAKIAVKAGILAQNEYAMIRLVEGYNQKESRRIDDRREQTRRGEKKAEHVTISKAQAKALKTHPDTPQGRRDALLMCLLLDHGLRVGEVALLTVKDFDLKSGELRFYRPKVDKIQTHRLTRDTLAAVKAWSDSGDMPLAADAPILRGSRKGGALTGAGMIERAITKRVNELGERVGVIGLSAHDCRHYWATTAARNGTDPFALQEAGGWSSLAMPRRYTEDAKIANEGVRLD